MSGSAAAWRRARPSVAAPQRLAASMGLGPTWPTQPRTAGWRATWAVQPSAAPAGGSSPLSTLARWPSAAWQPRLQCRGAASPTAAAAAAGHSRRLFSSQPPVPPKDEAKPIVIHLPPPPGAADADSTDVPHETAPGAAGLGGQQPEVPAAPPADGEAAPRPADAADAADAPSSEARDAAADVASAHANANANAQAAAAARAQADADAEPGLPSATESRRSRLNAGFSHIMDEFQDRVLTASQALNDLTGYSAIEHIKRRNAELETELAAAQAELHTARREYQAVNERRAGTQREVTTLLARKDTWAPADLERFTTLYRADHELEAAAVRAVERLKEAEATEARLSNALTAGILKRYHEEQVWSDRIRRQSTWGTWGLMAVNVLLFLALQVFAEPWRRRRLLRGIADAESVVLDDVRRELADVRVVLAAVATSAAQAPEAATAEAHAEAQDAAAEALAASDAAADDNVPAPDAATAGPRVRLREILAELGASPRSWHWTWDEVRSAAVDAADLPGWKVWAHDLCSERLVHLRMRDVSLIAAQGAAAGASVVVALFLLLRRS